MTEALLLLRLEHHNMDDLLLLIEQQLDRDSLPDLELLQNIMAYFADYPDQCHHPVEDLIYRKLHRRNPSRAEPVGTMLQSHRDISALTRACQTALSDAADDRGPGMAALNDTLREFVAHYRAHMGEEEREFFPLARGVLSGDDWAEVDYKLFDSSDPLFDREVEERFTALRQRIDKLADRSSRRAALLRTTKTLRRLTDVKAFNDLMAREGQGYRLVEDAEGCYVLEQSGKRVIDIPKCAPARAVWSAYFFIEALSR